MSWDDRQAQERVARLDALIGELEALPEPARSTAMGAFGALVEVYGEGLARIVARLPSAIAEEVAEDDLVAHLLLVHGVHPLDLRTRVTRALDEVRPYLQSHGGDVELLDVDGGDVRLRMDGSCSGCPSSTVTLKLAIDDAIRRHAPDVGRIEAGAVSTVAAEADGGASWVEAGPLTASGRSGTLLRQVSGEPLLFVRLEGSLYAYRPACPGCGAALEGATLLDGHLVCAECGRAYDVRGAGRCRDHELALEPVPLLVGGEGIARVALRKPAAGEGAACASQRAEEAADDEAAPAALPVEVAADEAALRVEVARP